MVSARSTTFLLILILLPLSFSTAADTQHQGKNTLLVATGGKLDNVNVEIYQGVPAVAKTDQRTRFLPGLGRKMMSKLNVVGSESGNAAMGSTNKGKASCVIGTCNHEEGKGILKVKHEFSKRSSDLGTKVKRSGNFVPLNADYYVPRPHPPKNN